MKVILINPSSRGVYSKISASLGKTPPVNLAAIAAYLREREIEVTILDAAVLGLDFSQIEDFLSQGFDVVGVSSFTPTLNDSIEILRIAKKQNQNCVTVIGGAHVSALPKETLAQHAVIDYGIIGEGEITFYQLLRCLQNKDDPSTIPGLALSDAGNIKITSKRDLIEDLDSLPFPAYDLLPMDKYSLKLHHIWSSEKIAIKPYTDLFTSRGCPYECTFCASKVIWGRKVRYKSSHYVLGEIDFLVQKYGIRAIEICDDTFLINKPRLDEILQGLLERNYDINFTCMSRVDDVDLETLKKLKKSGFRLIRFGVESCSQKILDAMKKGTKVEEIRRVFKLAKEAKIAATACIIIGYPGETRQTFECTLQTLKEIEPTAVDFFIAIPIVGTELYRIAKENNYLSNEDWSNWTLIPERPPINTPYLNSQELKGMLKEAYKSFYFRPAFMLRCIRQLRSWQQVKIYLKAFKAFLSVLISRR